MNFENQKPKKDYYYAYMGGDNNSIITSQCQATNTMIEAKMCSLTEKLGRGNTLK